MATPIYPKLLGETWPVLKESMHSNIVQTGASGLEVRSALYSQARYKFTIPYGYACHDQTVATADLQIILGLFDAQHGRLFRFLYDDPTDNYAVGSNIGIGDGVTTSFQLARSMGISTHLVYDVNSLVTAPIIYINGGVDNGHSIDANGLVTFGGPPSNGSAITATFHYYFRVRFNDDSLELTNEYGPYWTIKKVTLMETQI